MAEFVDGVDGLIEQFKKLPIVLRDFEDILLIDTPEHHMIDAGSAGLS